MTTTKVQSEFIAADAVTGAKIADDAIDSEHYTDGSIDTAHIADNAITSAKIAAGVVVAADIANDSIDSQHYVAASIDNEHLADDAVDSDEIAAGAIDLAHMSVNSIDSDQYVDGSIDAAHLAADVVTGAKIADDAIDSEHYTDGSIDTAHIADDAVTSAKLDTNIAVGGTLGVTGVTTLTTHLVMGDSDIIKLGADADLQIYHDGSNSYINNIVGDLKIQSSSAGGDIYLNSADAEVGLKVAENGAVTLYYDNSVKLATTSSGADITGTLEVDNITIATAQGSDGQLLTSTGSGVGWEDAPSSGIGMGKAIAAAIVFG